MRSFALQLDIDHSTLSQLMRGKRPLTERMIEKLGSRLRLERTAIEAFVTREKLLAPRRPQTLGQVRQLTRDAVRIVSDLHHFAILELVRLEEFEPDSRWIARVLGISVDEVNLALSRLLRVGLLEMTDRSHWTDNTGHITASIEDLAYVAAERMMEQVRRLSVRPTGEPGSSTAKK